MRYKQWGVCGWSQPSVICTIWTCCATELTMASSYKHTLCKSARQRVASLEPAVWCGAGPFHMPAATSLEEMNDQLAVLISLTMVANIMFLLFISLPIMIIRSVSAFIMNTIYTFAHFHNLQCPCLCCSDHICIGDTAQVRHRDHKLDMSERYNILL